VTLSAVYQNTLLRFLVVGGVMAVVYGMLAAAATSHLPLPKSVSAVGSWLICMPLAYFWQRRFTFAGSSPHRHALWLYAATQALSMAIVAGASQVLASGVFRADLVVHLGASAFAAMASFAINRIVIFPKG